MRRTLITVDFETEEIENDVSTSVNPPRAVGVSIKIGSQRSRYYAWGHPTANNCTERDAVRTLEAVYRDRKPGTRYVFFNAKFDRAVWRKLVGRAPAWSECEDAMFLVALENPHARNLGLKPSAERLLDLPPEEQDAVREWLIANKICQRNDQKWGRFIAKAPGDLVGKYACGDTDRTHALFVLLYERVCNEMGMRAAYERELRLAPVLEKNEIQGVRMNTRTIASDLVYCNAAYEQTERWLLKKLGVKELNWDAPVAVADAFDRAGIITEWEQTAKGNRSTSKKTLTHDKYTSRKFYLAYGYLTRLKTCLENLQRWEKVTSKWGGRVHPTWNQLRNSRTDGFAGTRTGRISCDHPNLTNPPSAWYDKGDDYEQPTFLKMSELPLLRRHFLPEKGHMWLHRDYSQQELRILAHYEEASLMDAYKEDPNMDVHKYVGDEMNALREQVGLSQLSRRPVKILNFGQIYGMGSKALAGQMGVTEDEARQLNKQHKQALPGVKSLNDTIKELVRAGDPIRTWGGRVYYVEEPKIVDGKWRSFEYKLLNYLIQGSGADAMKEAIIRHDATASSDTRFLATVYDELNVTAPSTMAKHEMEVLRKAMESVEFDVPLLSEGKIVKNWAEAK